MTATTTHDAIRPSATEARRWNREFLLRDDGRGSWRLALDPLVVAEFDRFCRDEPEQDVDTFEFDHRRLPELSRFGRELGEQIFEREGFALVDLRAGWTESQRRLLYLAIGCALGRPMTNYGRLYEVTDRGGSFVDSAIPVSQTNAPTGFHTDSSARAVNPDVVALLCEQPGVSGGDSLISNALRVVEELKAHAPDDLEVLRRAWVRDVVTPGTEKNLAALQANRFPVVADGTDGRLTFRYMRFWIERGNRKAGSPLDAATLAVFDRLDAALAAEPHCLQVRLEKGHALFVNNRFLAHNRTAYQDDPLQPRRLQRMWIARA